ncbi:unnamed protein product [Urochloa humidicola]
MLHVENKKLSDDEKLPRNQYISYVNTLYFFSSTVDICLGLSHWRETQTSPPPPPPPIVVLKMTKIQRTLVSLIIVRYIFTEFK